MSDFSALVAKAINPAMTREEREVVYTTVREAVTRLQERLALSRYRRPFLATGFCGALTTFSTSR